MKDGFNEMAGIFLQDLGLEAAEAESQEGAAMDYLPVQRSEHGLTRPVQATPVPYTPGRVSQAEERILKRARVDMLIQDAATELVGRGIEKSMDEARRAVATYFESTEIMLAVVDAARTEKHRIVMEKLVDRLIHDRGQALAHNLRMGDRMRAELTEEGVEHMKRAANERSFWDSVFRR